MYIIMKRKIAQIGPSTLMVSIPSGWAKQFSLKKSQEVNLEVEGNKLIISVEKLSEPKSTNLDVSKLGPMMLRYIVSLYKKGYDEITVHFDNPELIGNIQAAIGKEAVGFEIMEQGKNNLVIRNISETLSEYDSAMRRTLRLLVSMADETHEALSHGEFDRLNNIAFLEEANNRFTTTIRRALNKKGLPDHDNTSMFYYIVEELEKIADQYKYLCTYFYKNNDSKFDKKTLQSLWDANECLRMFSEVFFKYDERKIVLLGEERKRLVMASLKVIEDGNKADRVLAHYVLTIVQEVFCLVGPYLAIHF